MILLELLLVFLLVCLLIAIPVGIYRGTRKHFKAKREALELVKHTRDECKCNRPGCPICDGGLFMCTVCGALEGSLTTHCPGVKVPTRVQDNVYHGYLDFVNGRWVTSMPKGARV